MRAGLLDTIVTILRPQVTRNSVGEQVQTYEQHYQTKARVINGGGTRTVENGEILHTYSKSIEVWKYVDIAETDWVEIEGVQYRILEIETDKRQLKKVIRLDKIND